MRSLLIFHLFNRVAVRYHTRDTDSDSLRTISSCLLFPASLGNMFTLWAGMMKGAYPEMRLKHMLSPLPDVTLKFKTFPIKPDVVWSLVVRFCLFVFFFFYLHIEAESLALSPKLYHIFSWVLLIPSSLMWRIPSQSCGAWVPYKLKFNVCYYDH